MASGRIHAPAVTRFDSALCYQRERPCSSVTAAERRELLADLRAAGATRWREGDVEVELGPLAPAADIAADANSCAICKTFCPDNDRHKNCDPGGNIGVVHGSCMLGHGPPVPPAAAPEGALTADDRDALFQHERA